MQHHTIKPSLRWIWWGAVLGWMGVIFLFSAQNGEESGATSNAFTAYLWELATSWGLDGALDAVLTTFPLRKIAHFAVYAVLGVLCVKATRVFPLSGAQAASLAWLLSTLYACTDEWHQAFVPGRAAQWRDVGIDSLGALCGILLTVGVIALYHRHKRNNGAPCNH